MECSTVELVWTGHDNSIDLILKADGAAVSLAATTYITASFGKKRVESVSTDGAATPVKWKQAGYDTGEVKLFLATVALSPGSYDVPIITYAENGSSNGLVWGKVKVKVIPEVEATAT